MMQKYFILFLLFVTKVTYLFFYYLRILYFKQILFEKSIMIENLKENYSYLFENELLIELDECGVYKEFEAGKVFLKAGQYIKSMPLLLSGTIKISRKDSNGDEILLYFIEKGDTCAMSMSCCMNNTKSEIQAVAETDTKLIMVPISKMDDWMAKYKSWREFIINSYQARLNEVIQTIDSLVFSKMDERLLNYLQDKTKIFHTSKISITHKEIAKDFHTSRVVISRLLKKLELNNDVKLHRNAIEVFTL